MKLPGGEKSVFVVVFVCFLCLYFVYQHPDTIKVPTNETPLDVFIRSLSEVVDKRDLPGYMDHWYFPEDKTDRLIKRKKEFLEEYGSVLWKKEGITRGLLTNELRFSGEHAERVELDYDYRDFKKTKNARLRVVKHNGRWLIEDLE